MNMDMNIEMLLAPIPGENPSGEDLRYTQVYDEIKEARRADDPLSMGEWQREAKVSEWEKVISGSLDALEKRSKDLQIAAWLAEALTVTRGFKGLECGIMVITGLMDDFWDTLYPLPDEGDLEFRIAPFEFINDRLCDTVRQITLTDPGLGPRYSWLKWRESREVGYDADTKNSSGDYDVQKKKRRDELMEDGKISAEQFDAAVAKTPPEYIESLMNDLFNSNEAFKKLDAIVDERFGGEAPRLSDLGQALEECCLLMNRLASGKYRPVKSLPADSYLKKSIKEGGSSLENGTDAVSVIPDEPESISTRIDEIPIAAAVNDTAAREEGLWAEAMAKLETGGFKDALDDLLSISNSRPSVRGRNRYRLLIAKLCLKAGRHDLARPIIEQLHALIGELKLEQWESPLWIAEVLEVFYQCLTSGEPSDEDKSKAGELFTRICTMDVTKALVFRK